MGGLQLCASLPVFSRPSWGPPTAQMGTPVKGWHCPTPKRTKKVGRLSHKRKCRQARRCGRTSSLRFFATSSSSWPSCFHIKGSRWGKVTSRVGTSVRRLHARKPCRSNKSKLRPCVVAEFNQFRAPNLVWNLHFGGASDSEPLKIYQSHQASPENPRGITSTLWARSRRQLATGTLACSNQ